MAEVQSLKKTDDVKNCLDPADNFIVKLFEKYSECDELRLIFDRYDIHYLYLEGKADNQQSPIVPQIRLTSPTLQGRSFCLM